jgi:hypothetical protein
MFAQPAFHFRCLSASNAATDESVLVYDEPGEVNLPMQMIAHFYFDSTRFWGARTGLGDSLGRTSYEVWWSRGYGTARFWSYRDLKPA